VKYQKKVLNSVARDDHSFRFRFYSLCFS